MLLPETLKLHNKQSFEFYYIYFLPWKNQMVSALEENGGVVKCFSATNNIRIIFKLRSVIRFIRRENIQLVHCHLPWAGFVGRLVYRVTGIPVIYTEHNKQERYHFVTRLLNRLTFNWQTNVVAVSGDVKYSIQKNIHPRIPVYEVLNGVNVESFKRNAVAGAEIRRNLGIPSDAIVVGTVAVFRFQKRIKEWLEVFSRAASQNPHLFGIIVGDGPLKNEIMEHRRALQLEDKILMPGLQTEVRPWFSAMDIFMMTSIFEGLPIALLEAMSMECTIVTTDAGGIKQVIQNDSNGKIVSAEKWEQLEGALKQVVSDAQLRKRLSIAARQTVTSSYSMDRMVNELEELYLKIIHRKN